MKKARNDVAKRLKDAEAGLKREKETVVSLKLLLKKKQDQVNMKAKKVQEKSTEL